MDGVLCKATMAGYTPAEAVASIFTDHTTKIGVMAQVFTIVNDPMYDYPDWDSMKGWNYDLVAEAAVYQGSTTGQSKDNDQECGATGGMVTWHVDRDCHHVSAKAIDNLCKHMLMQHDDMANDVHPHGSRDTVLAEFTTDVAMKGADEDEEEDNDTPK